MEIKKNHSADLENYTRLFRELGLVLSLLIVFLAIEHKTYNKSNTGLEIVIRNNYDDEKETIEIEIEQISTPPPPAAVVPEIIEIVENETDVEETIIESTETDEFEKIEVAEIIEVEEEDNFVEDVPFAIIEEVPIYPGCEKEKGRDAKKNCLNKSLQKHVSENFNLQLASDLGLSPGKNKIYIQFKITKTGSIEVIGARAPHVRLEKEATRVVNLLPKMTPGKQRGRSVNVNYMLPISFVIE